MIALCAFFIPLKKIDMSTLCDNILRTDIMAACDNIGEIGFKKRGYMFNYEEVDRSTMPSANGELSSIKMLGNGKGVRVQQLGKTPFEGTNTAMVVGAYRNSFTNQVKIFVPDTADCAPVVDAIATGKFIVILDNGAGGFRVYGYYNGLSATEITQTPYSEETDAGWVITLEETKAMSSRITYTGTATQLEGLCKAVS